MKKIVKTEDYTTIPEGVIFSASWIFKGVVWSNTYKFEEGVCYCYNSDLDSWIKQEFPQVTIAPFTGHYVSWFTYIG